MDERTQRPAPRDFPLRPERLPMHASHRTPWQLGFRRASAAVALARVGMLPATRAQQPAPLAGRMYDTDGTVRCAIAADLAVDGDLDLDAVAVTDGITLDGDSFTIHANTRVESPRVYCVARCCSTCCLPRISFSGAPSVSSATIFSIQASSLRNPKPGLLFYGCRAMAASFQGGTLCVDSPTRRTPMTSSAGNASAADDCSGNFAFDFNAWIQSGADPALVVGADVYAQHWSRDPASPSTTGLTNASYCRVRP